MRWAWGRHVESRSNEKFTTPMMRYPSFEDEHCKRINDHDLRPCTWNVRSLNSAVAQLIDVSSSNKRSANLVWDLWWGKNRGVGYWYSFQWMNGSLFFESCSERSTRSEVTNASLFVLHSCSLKVRLDATSAMAEVTLRPAQTLRLTGYVTPCCQRPNAPSLHDSPFSTQFG